MVQRQLDEAGGQLRVGDEGRNEEVDGGAVPIAEQAGPASGSRLLLGVLDYRHPCGSLFYSDSRRSGVDSMAPLIVVQDFRPDEIIQAYWEQILDIGQDDDLFPVELLMAGDS